MRLKEKEHFQDVAKDYDRRYYNPIGLKRMRRRIELFSRCCGLKKGARVLEIGSATGELSKGMKGCGYDIIISDLSLNMLLRTKEKLDKNSSCRMLVCDAERLPVKDAFLDGIVGNSILHHMDLQVASSEISRVLKEGGRFIFSEPNMVNPFVFLQKNVSFIRKFTGDSDKETAFNRWYIKNIFKKAGFREVEAHPFDFLNPYMPQLLSGAIDGVGRCLEKIPLLREFAGSIIITGRK